MRQFFEYGVVAVLSILFFAFYQFQSDFLPGTDGYYHIKVAYVMRELGFLSEFKWAHLSLWRDQFSDKEFLYHVYLIPFTFFKDLIMGAKIGTVLLAAAGSTSLYAILRLNKVSYAWLWLLLLFMSGGYFLYRANVTRPQVLSIIFVLWSIHFIINRKFILLAILCFLYTFSYTAYHLPFIFACIVYTYRLLLEGKNEWKLPAVTLGATLLGVLMSPFFPHNAELFYLQNFYIPYMAGNTGIDLHMGGEFGPMDTRAMLMVNTAVVIPFIAAFFTAIFKPDKRDHKTISIFLIALSLILITCLSKRFAEYSIPVTLMFCGFFFSPYLQQLDWKKELRTAKGILISLMVVLILTGLGYNSYQNTVNEFRGAREPTLKQSALYLLENTDEDELVFTADWDDAPELFFYNHKNRYLVFLDPNFMYYWDQKIWSKWDALSNGRLGNQTYDVLKNEFQVRYGVATNNFGKLKNIIQRDNRMKIVHQSPGAYVFKLGEDKEDNYPEAVEFKPPTFKEVVQYFMNEEGLTKEEAEDKAARFYDFFVSKKWMMGEGISMTDWKKQASRSLAWE